MLARTDTVATIAESWLAQLEAALAGPGRARLKELFQPDSHWRDVLALSWRIMTVGGADTIVRELATHAGRAGPTGFRLDRQRAAPRKVTRAGTDAIEAIFGFETTPAPHRDGDGSERHCKRSGYSGPGKFRGYRAALQPLRGRRGVDEEECPCHRLGQQRA